MYNSVNCNSDFIQLVVHHKYTWLHRNIIIAYTENKMKLNHVKRLFKI